MDDLPPGASKEEMIPAVAKHFSQQVCWSWMLHHNGSTKGHSNSIFFELISDLQVVDEKDTLVNFALSLKRHYLLTRQSPQQPLKKPRNATKVKAR